MKVLFLDFDGVLNSTQSTILSVRQEQDPVHDLCRVACSNLQLIIETVPGLKIVVSSSWRKLYSLDWLKEHLAKYGVDSSVLIDLTPARFSSRPRGYEIQEWLDDYKQEHPEDPITHFAIVDDDADMKHLMDNLVQTNAYIGLTYGKATDIVKMLGSDMEAWEPAKLKKFPYHLLSSCRTETGVYTEKDERTPKQDYEERIAAKAEVKKDEESK